MFLVLENPCKFGKKVSENINIPTIGIGAGSGCDGQVLVYHDMVGMNKWFFSKIPEKIFRPLYRNYRAVSQYVKDVKDVNFPNEERELLDLNQKIKLRVECNCPTFLFLRKIRTVVEKNCNSILCITFLLISFAQSAQYVAMI